MTQHGLRDLTQHFGGWISILVHMEIEPDPTRPRQREQPVDLLRQLRGHLQKSTQRDRAMAQDTSLCAPHTRRAEAGSSKSSAQAMPDIARPLASPMVLSNCGIVLASIRRDSTST